MKKIKLFIFLFLTFICFNVSASEFNMNNYTSATLNGTKNRYRATEIYNTGQSGTYTFSTRYNGQISDIETYFEYPFSENISYTLTYNMATNDFRNNFGTAYWWDCSQSMTNINAVVQGVSFISKQKVKVSFKPSENTTCIRVWLRSTDLSTTPITGISNWQLNSITIYDPEWQSGSGSGQGSTTAPTPSPNSNQDIINNNNNNTQDIINNNNNNTQDIINNNNQNTQDIIDNQNSNQEQTNQLLGSCYKNLYNYLLVNSLTNLNYSNGSYIQNSADSLSEPRLKLQFYSDLLGNNFVQSDYTPTIAIGTFKWTFIKTSNLNYMSFGVNGSTTDSLVNFYDISNLENGLAYSLIYTVSNITQGSITITDVMLINGYDTIPYTPYNKTYCKSKLDSVGDTILNGAGSIIDSVNQSQQDIINNQNSNTQKEIDSQKVCTVIDKNIINTDNKVLSSVGAEFTNDDFGVSDYISISSNDTLTLLMNMPSSASASGYMCFFNINKTTISCTSTRATSITNINIPDNASYVRFSINKSLNKPQFKICRNGNQALQNSITDESVPEIELDLDLDTNSPVSDLLTMPLTLLNKVFDLSDNTCQPYVLPFDFFGGNNTVSFPCIDLKDYLGVSVYNILDTILCFYFCYEIGMMCITIYEDITSLRDGFDSLYTPKHGKPLGKHTSEVY